MKNIGFGLYDIPLPAHILEVTFSREYLSETYGGNRQQAFPKIAQKHFNRHGLNFMYVNPDLNPHAPQIPGAPGLFFECEKYRMSCSELVVITKLATGKWQLQGFYHVIPSASLTKEEWQAQEPSVSFHFSDHICICLTKIKGQGRVAQEYTCIRLWAQCSSAHHPSATASSGAQST
jgi:hypothetical protein